MNYLEIYSIPFTQFIPPHGEKREIFFSTTREELKSLSRYCIENGVTFEIERLRTGEVHIESVRDVDGEPVTISGAITENGPPIVHAVGRLIQDTADFLRIEKKKPSKPQTITEAILDHYLRRNSSATAEDLAEILGRDRTEIDNELNDLPLDKYKAEIREVWKLRGGSYVERVVSWLPTDTLLRTKVLELQNELNRVKENKE